MPMFVLELQFLVFLTQQVFLYTGIRTDFTRFQKAADVNLEQGLLDTFLGQLFGRAIGVRLLLIE